MRERYGFREGLCPVAEGISTATLALPFHARLEAGDQERRRRGAPRSAARVRREPGQGEALLVWGLWALVALAVLVTYSRLDPSLLYHTTGDGLGGGLSRVAVLLTSHLARRRRAHAALPRRAVRGMPGGSAALRSRSAPSPPSPVSSARKTSTHAGSTRFRPPVSLSRSASPAVAALRAASRSPHLCPATGSGSCWASSSASSPYPGSSQSSASTCRATSSSARRSPDRRRTSGRRPPRPPPRPRRRPARGVRAPPLAAAPGRPFRRVYVAYVALAFGYGAVNFAQDLWQEQLVKRGWVDWSIPTALEPGLAAGLAGDPRAVRPGLVVARARARDTTTVSAPGMVFLGLRQVRARRPDLRARADHRRQPRQRPAHARLGGGHPRAGGRVADAGDDPRGDGPRGRGAPRQALVAGPVTLTRSSSSKTNELRRSRRAAGDGGRAGAARLDAARRRGRRRDRRDGGVHARTIRQATPSAA